MTGLKKYFRNQVFENVVFLHVSPPQISSLFSFSYNLFSANRAFPLHVVLFISKNFNLNVHALVVVPFATAAAVCHKTSIIRFNIIIKVSFPTDTIYIKKQRNRSIAIKLFIGLWKRRKIF